MKTAAFSAAELCFEAGYPGPRICRTFTRKGAAVSSQGLPEIAGPLGGRPKADHAAGSFARRSAKADRAARTSSRRSGKVDHAARTSPRRSAKADNAARTSSRRSAKADRAARTSSRRSAKADCAARTSSRRSAKADCAARTSPRRSAKADRPTRTSSRRSAKADRAARTSSRRSGKPTAPPGLLHGEARKPTTVVAFARTGFFGRAAGRNGALPYNARKSQFLRNGDVWATESLFLFAVLWLAFLPGKSETGVAGGGKPAAPKPRPPRGGPAQRPRPAPGFCAASANARPGDPAPVCLLEKALWVPPTTEPFRPAPSGKPERKKERRNPG